MAKNTSRPVRNVLGSQIREKREAKGWSQADLVRKLQLRGWDIERTVLTKIENRRRCITDYELIAIAQTLGVTINELLPPENPDVRSFFAS